MSEDGRTWDLHITDTGSAKGLLALAGWAGIEGENETSTGYDKTYHEDGRLVHEQWDRISSRGEYGMVLGERFTVKSRRSGRQHRRSEGGAGRPRSRRARIAMKGEGVTAESDE